MIHSESLLAAAFIVGALVAPGWAIAARTIAKRQERWPCVIGRVLESKVDYWGGSTQPLIEYTYEFRGREYWANRIVSPEVSLWLPRAAARVIAKYPVGSSTQVFVDPQKPSRAVLQPGGDHRLVPITMAFAAFFLLVGVKLLQ